MSAEALTPGAVDGFALRSCLARFATGVTVLAAEGPEGRVGMTVNSFTAVSLEPPLVLVSILKAAHRHDVFVDAPFTVNVLGAEQEPLARHFAGRPFLDAVAWEESAGTPVLTGALAVVDCSPWGTYDGGDHSLVLGRVERFSYREGDALGYFCGRFVPLEAPVLGIEFLY